MKLIQKLRKILTRREKWQLLLLLVPMSISAMLDVFGIAFVAPFMAMVANPDIIHQSQKVAWLYQLSHTSTPHRFLLFLGLLVLALLLLGNGFSMLTYWLIVRFSHRRGHAISYRLLEQYLKQPYVYFLNKNSASLTKRIFTDAYHLVHQILIPLMICITKGIAVLLIITLLVVVKPLLALIMIAVLGTLCGIIYLSARKALKRVSIQLTESQENRYHIVNEALGGIKDIKLMHNENYFLKLFHQANILFSKAQALSAVISQAPKYIIETVAFGGILILVIFLLATERNTAHVIPLLAMYAFAGYRLMPSLHTLFVYNSLIKSNIGSIDAICHDISEMEPVLAPLDEVQKMPFHKTIACQRIFFTYPDSTVPVLNDFSLTIQVNTTIGFVGKTGAGKTTAIDLILGLLKPQSGLLRVDGCEVSADNQRAWQKNIGYVPQHIYLSDRSIAENIAFGMDLETVDQKRVVEAAKLANIHDFILTLPDSYETTVGERGVRLSGGQRQRIGIARALYRNPSVLILDEATSALDSETETAVMDAIHSLSGQKTILIIAHRTSTLEACDGVYELRAGACVERVVQP